MQVDVQTAASQMKNDTDHSTEEFMGFVNGQGHTFEVKLNSHFSFLSNKLVNQQENIDSLETKTTSYAEKYESGILKEISRTGQTPKKVTPAPLADLSFTRPHQDIKNDAYLKCKDFSKNSLLVDNTVPIKSLVNDADQVIVENAENNDPQLTNAKTAVLGARSNFGFGKESSSINSTRGSKLRGN
jgi:hypothetical protein